MKLSALIKALEDAHAAFGDIDVMMQSDADESSEDVGGVVCDEEGKSPALICGQLTFEGYQG